MEYTAAVPWEPEARRPTRLHYVRCQWRPSLTGISFPNDTYPPTPVHSSAARAIYISRSAARPRRSSPGKYNLAQRSDAGRGYAAVASSPADMNAGARAAHTAPYAGYLRTACVHPALQTAYIF